jgi:hypothetical protein
MAVKATAFNIWKTRGNLLRNRIDPRILPRGQAASGLRPVGGLVSFPASEICASTMLIYIFRSATRDPAAIKFTHG